MPSQQKPKNRNEALEMAMRRGQAKAGFASKEVSSDKNDVPTSSLPAPPKEEQQPKDRNEALEMAMRRGQQKAGLMGVDVSEAPPCSQSERKGRVAKSAGRKTDSSVDPLNLFGDLTDEETPNDARRSTPHTKRSSRTNTIDNSNEPFGLSTQDSPFGTTSAPSKTADAASPFGDVPVLSGGMISRQAPSTSIDEMDFFENIASTMNAAPTGIQTFPLTPPLSAKKDNLEDVMSSSTPVMPPAPMASAAMFPLTQAIELPKEELHVDLKLDGDFKSFNEEAKEKLLQDLAVQLGVPRHLIELGPCEEGSIKCKIIIKKPTDGTPAPNLQAVQAKASTLSGKSLGGYPCMTVKPAVVLKPQQNANNSADARAEAAEREVTRLREEIKSLTTKNAYLLKSLESAEATVDNIPPDMNTARNKIGDLEVELMKAELESKAKDDLVRSLRLSLNQLQKDQVVKEQEHENAIRGLREKITNYNSGAVEEMACKLRTAENNNAELQRMLDTATAEAETTESKLQMAQNELTKYKNNAQINNFGDASSDSAAELMKVQEAHLAELALIKAAEQEEKTVIQQRYCLKSIQAVMARMTKGAVAACVVRWRMEMVKDVDTSVASKVAAFEKEFADKSYEHERAIMGKRVDDVEKALLEKVALHESEKRELTAKMQETVTRAKSETASIQLLNSQLEIDLRDARKEVYDLKELNALHESEGGVSSTRVGQLESELSEMRRFRDRSHTLEKAFESSKTDSHHALQRSGMKMLKATLMRMRAAAAASCLFEWRRKMEVAGLGLHYAEELARKQEEHAVKVLQFEATLKQSKTGWESAASRDKAELSAAFNQEMAVAAQLHEDSMLSIRTEMEAYKTRVEAEEKKESARRQKLLDAGCTRLEITLARVHKGRVLACLRAWSTRAFRGVGSMQLEELKHTVLQQQQQERNRTQEEVSQLQSELVSARSNLAAELEQIRASEAAAAHHVRQQASLKNISAVMTRITMGIVAACVVTWRMEAVLSIDLSRARNVAERDLEAARSHYENDVLQVKRELKLEMATMQQRMEDAENSRSQSAAELEDQHRSRMEEQEARFRSQMADVNEGHTIAYNKLQAEHEAELKQAEARRLEQSAGFESLREEAEAAVLRDNQLNGVRRVGYVMAGLMRSKLGGILQSWKHNTGSAKNIRLQMEMDQLNEARRHDTGAHLRLVRSLQLTKYCFLWFHYAMYKRAWLTSCLATWRDQLMCEVANAMMGGYGGELDSEYVDADSDEMASHVDDSTVGRLWGMLLALDQRSGEIVASKGIRVDLFLRVCAVYAPEVSTVGIRETLLSLGLRDGLIKEEVFQQWMAIMFTGCNEVEVQYGVNELVDAVNQVDAEIIAV